MTGGRQCLSFLDSRLAVQSAGLLAKVVVVGVAMRGLSKAVMAGFPGRVV